MQNRLWPQGDLWPWETQHMDDEYVLELSREHRQRLIAELAEQEPELAARLGIRRRAG